MKPILEFISTSFPSDITQLIQAGAKLADHNQQNLVLVGGVVRDYLLGRGVHEADLMLEPPVKPWAERLAAETGGRLVFHEAFLTFTIHLPSGGKVDLVTAREESYPKPAVLPVVKPSTIENDLKRRDFTINAMACRLSQKGHGDILDLFGGRKDMDAKFIRALHEKSFIDDPTRIYRAARFAGRLGFQVEGKTMGWISDSIKQGIPKLLSPVRRRHEFEILLKEEDPTPALLNLTEWGALEMLHPDWKGIPATVFGTNRLVDWFRPMGKATAEKQMTDLAFERKVKKQVLDLI